MRNWLRIGSLLNIGLFIFSLNLYASETDPTYQNYQNCLDKKNSNQCFCKTGKEKNIIFSVSSPNKELLRNACVGVINDKVKLISDGNGSYKITYPSNTVVKAVLISAVDVQVSDLPQSQKDVADDTNDSSKSNSKTNKKGEGQRTPGQEPSDKPTSDALAENKSVNASILGEKLYTGGGTGSTGSNPTVQGKGDTPQSNFTPPQEVKYIGVSSEISDSTQSTIDNYHADLASANGAGSGYNGQITDFNARIETLENKGDAATPEERKELRGLKREKKQLEKSIAAEKTKNESKANLSEHEAVNAMGAELESKFEECATKNAGSTAAINKCKEDAMADHKAKLVNEQIPEMARSDFEATKEYNPDYFQANIGIRLFDKNTCTNVFNNLSEKNKDKLKKIMEEPMPGEEYLLPTSCQRYVTGDLNNFYSKVRNLVDSGASIDKDKLCTDVAFLQDDSCHTSAQTFLQCDEINPNNVAEMLNENLCEGITLANLPQNQSANCISVEEAMVNKDLKSFEGRRFCDYQGMASACKSKCAGNAKENLKQCYANVGISGLSDRVEPCFAYKAVATINYTDGGEQIDRSDLEYASFDGVYTCQRTSPYTADYQDCKKLVIAYNAAFAAEQGMAMAEGIQQSAAQADASASYATGTATGNGQLAALGSVKTIATANKSIQTQKAALYTAQSVVFGAMLIEWPTVANIRKTCKRKDVEHAQECTSAVHFLGESAAKEVLFPNYNVKQAFYAELIESAGNAAVALITRSMYKKQEEMVEAVENMTVEDSDGSILTGVSYCSQYPNSSQCKGSGNRVSVDGYSGGGLNVVGGGSNDYAFSSDDLGEYNEGRETPSNATIDDINSMLNDGAEKATGDFKKVAGADITSSPSGGGGGGGAGGGSASLVGGGSGGPGGEEKASDSYGVTKSGAKYASSGGSAGYGGSKAKQFGKDKKVDNPFSSLFGAKKNSRNVASDAEDIAPAESSLFKKISNRYMEVKNQKRLLDSQVK